MQQLTANCNFELHEMHVDEPVVGRDFAVNSGAGTHIAILVGSQEKLSEFITAQE